MEKKKEGRKGKWKIGKRKKGKGKREEGRGERIEGQAVIVYRVII